MIERRRKSETLQILFLLVMLSGMLTLSYYVYLRPAVLGLEVPEYAGPASGGAVGLAGANLETMRLYFANERYDGLVAVEREAPARTGVVAKARQALAELAAGPGGVERVAPTVPKETRADAIFLIDDLLVVDLSKEIAQRLLGGLAQERMSVHSIVNTLCEIPGVRRVRLLLDGQPVDTLAGHLNLRRPLRADTTLLTAQ